MAAMDLKSVRFVVWVVHKNRHGLLVFVVLIF